MNRMLATPTFLAGACFVVAATLAYGTTQTHLLYSDPGCQAAHCSTGHANGNGGGVPLKTKARRGVGSEHGPGHGHTRIHQAEGAASLPAVAHRPASPSSGQSSPPPQPPVATGGGQHGPQVTILFRTLSRNHGGFMAAITIVNHGHTALDGWQLWLRYRVTKFGHMWGARWFPMWGARWFPDSAQARNAGLAAAPANQPKVKPGGTERFTFWATGTPAAPPGCSFDGYRCSFGPPARGNRTDGSHHSHHAGGSR
jgi:hypothetical protein